MITHGTPPVAEGGWSEFIKDFGIGVLVNGALPSEQVANGLLPFATQLPDIGRDKTGQREFSGSEKPDKQGLSRPARYGNGRLFPNFKTGAPPRLTSGCILMSNGEVCRLANPRQHRTVPTGALQMDGQGKQSLVSRRSRLK